ncbi:Tc5 transposase DNA-binding domain protein [Rhizoctonia solani AG-3 Rhs1AP]|uniref:Tc5 transposase DNA-binding domain protein n=2 Tax=Rhizoctonia solani AG-3 TaxID=1086053 RepID=A0A074RM28_9AGAM|nr:Tc5 transposase DNA-binding domain protein [Rhizoctonia solani AG-3 Rhs1AP]KEP47889.1 Tc5 transposase DNA-binding domain protein [Rhizoctonia solani 123E]
MTEQSSFTYYQDPPSFGPFSSLQYPQPSYDVGYMGSDNNPFDSDFTGTQSPQNDTPSWSASFATSDTGGASFQRRGAVSDAVPEQTGPEAGSDLASRSLRIDTSCSNRSAEQHHVQEAGVNLGSPVNIRPQHLDSATTPTSFPPGPNTYETSTPPTTLDMNHQRGALPLSLTMPQNSPYYMGHHGIYDNQLPHPLSAHPGRPNHQLQDPRHYAPLGSPQLHMHPLSAPPYGPSAQSGLSIPYTPSSLTSSSARSVSPASTAATSAQPLDFSAYASPVGEYDMSAVSAHPSSAHQSSPLVSGTQPHSSIARSSAGTSRSDGSHVVSPIRRRANKQRLDDARRKEICSYARDRPKARQEDIAIKYGVERSTISKILKHKDKWLSLDTNPRKSIPVKHSSPVCIRPSKFPEIETELLKWVKQCQENGTNITDTRIKAKAKECAAEIGLPEGKFKASSGWIENFKLRNNLTRRSQDGQDASPAHEETEDPEQMDEDEDMPIPASQATQAEGDGYDADVAEQNSFNSLLTVSTDSESGLVPHDTSFSTFSTDSMMANNTQDLSMFHSNTPLSSAASSFASSPSGTRPQHVPHDPGLRSRAHSHSVAMRAVGPVGSPQPGLIQPMSPARLDMRFTSTPTSAAIPRFPSPLSASTSASGNGLVMSHNVRHSPVSQKHSRHPSDASAFSYDVASQASTDISSVSTPSFESPSPHQTLDALDMVLKYFEQPQTAGIASHMDRSTFAAVRQRLADRLVQSLPLSSESCALGSDSGYA